MYAATAGETGLGEPGLSTVPAAAQRRITGRTDGSIRLRATTIQTFSLAWRGASTDGKPTFAPLTPAPRCEKMLIFAPTGL